jgi:hypothetical protein
MMLSNRYRRVAFYSGDQPAQSDGRAISDDDLCAWCAHLHYCPGETSMCAQDWPPLAAAKASRCQRLLSELVSACCQR